MAAPLPRYVIVPCRYRGFEAYQEVPDGLIFLGHYQLEAGVRVEYPDARSLPAIWDAPVIDPADPETYPEDIRPPGWWLGYP